MYLYNILCDTLRLDLLLCALWSKGLLALLHDPQMLDDTLRAPYHATAQL